MYTYPFEKLEVWQLAKELVIKIYKITSLFPAEEKFGITNQIRRAAVSIASNIAEGSGRNTNKDQGHFFNMAFSSLLELLNQLIISTELKFLTEASLMELRSDIETVSRMLNALRKSAFNSNNK